MIKNQLALAVSKYKYSAQEQVPTFNEGETSRRND